MYLISKFDIRMSSKHRVQKLLPQYHELLVLFASSADYLKVAGLQDAHLNEFCEISGMYGPLFFSEFGLTSACRADWPLYVLASQALRSASMAGSPAAGGSVPP